MKAVAEKNVKLTTSIWVSAVFAVLPVREI